MSEEKNDRIVIVSNRLSVSAVKNGDTIEYAQSMGGLATGLSSLHGDYEMLWVGWPGIPREDLTTEEQSSMDSHLQKNYGCAAVQLSRQDVQEFYLGFCNNTIWPLFHYFPSYVEYNHELWNAYERVNLSFFEQLKPLLREDDIVWIHDYQLMLLPQLVRESFPDIRIGYFLHIPFPSYELFRLLPWRREILDGLLGSDLIGFHTYDYARHFLSAVRRIEGHDHHLGHIKTGGRSISVDVFPMGIDYDKFAESGKIEEVKSFITNIKRGMAHRKMILSVDRLDYSKGIPNRLWGFRYFLDKHPEWYGKVTLAMIVAPSREGVPQYQDLKREVEELVSDINGTFGTIEWVPVQYFYRPFPFTELTAMYSEASVLLVTPLRDGMNLIAKEYVAAKTDGDGVVILSETAGAARELGETIMVNPTNLPEIGEAINTALNMKDQDKARRNTVMHQRIRRYDIRTWAQDFTAKLIEAAANHNQNGALPLNTARRQEISTDFASAESRLLLLDYDGTLVGFKAVPEDATADSELHDLIASLADLPDTEVVIISGRDRDFLESQWDNLPVGLIAGHGVWQRRLGGEWEVSEVLDIEWKDAIRPVMQRYRDRTPGASIEEKAFSIAWHYRRSEPELAAIRLGELREALLGLTSNLNVSVLDGNKVLEVKNSSVNKGRGAARYMMGSEYKFILAAGDDHTDEDLFAMLPDHANSIKIGAQQTVAKYFLPGPKEVRKFLHQLLENSKLQ
ncbi:bifunctional alpha,alpha-trehalose-phosphate synthase (UDP-forming)/trehalose-phosphatase [Spirochaeta dissipatitropha]